MLLTFSISCVGMRIRCKNLSRELQFTDTTRSLKKSRKRKNANSTSATTKPSRLLSIRMLLASSPMQT